MKKATKIFVLFIVVLGLEVAVLAGSDDEPATFEGQLQKEIDDTHLLAGEYSVTYNPSTKALMADLYEETYWDADHLHDSICRDASDILAVAANHPGEINTVMVEYQSTLLDQNYNEVRERVFLGTWLTENTNQVNWENLYYNDALEGMLDGKAESFWFHPAITG